MSDAYCPYEDISKSLKGSPYEELIPLWEKIGPRVLYSNVKKASDSPNDVFFSDPLGVSILKRLEKLPSNPIIIQYYVSYNEDWQNTDIENQIRNNLMSPICTGGSCYFGLLRQDEKETRLILYLLQ